MAMSRFTIRVARDEDLAPLATVAIDAYITNPQTLTSWTTKEANRADLLSWRSESLRNDLINDASLSYLVLLDNDVNEIVAFAIWQKPEESLSKSQDESQPSLPLGMNVELYNQSVGQTERIKAKFVNREKDFGKWQCQLDRMLVNTSGPDTQQVLKSTATLPKHQGRGCCSLLLSYALKEVDSAGAKAFLKATPQGRPVYKRHGWQEVDALVYDLAKHGGPSALTLYAMERPPCTNVTSPEATSIQK